VRKDGLTQVEQGGGNRQPIVLMDAKDSLKLSSTPRKRMPSCAGPHSLGTVCERKKRCFYGREKRNGQVCGVTQGRVLSRGDT